MGGSQSCSLCGATGSDRTLVRHDVLPLPKGIAPGTPAGSALVCDGCIAALTTGAGVEGATAAEQQDRWRGVADSMWSENLPVQILAWRLLARLETTGNAWARALKDQMYFDDDSLAWAQAGLTGSAIGSAEAGEELPKDSNGTPLQAGDSVTLIKDLDVKGANFTAKRGTVVKNIVLTGDPKFVEGKVNGTTIVLVAAYLKRKTD